MSNFIFSLKKNMTNNTLQVQAVKLRDLLLKEDHLKKVLKITKIDSDQS